MSILNKDNIVSEDHIGIEIDEEGMPIDNYTIVRQTNNGPRCWFRCPKNQHQLYCGVPIKPSPPNSEGCSWDMKQEEPLTLSPSINCIKGCGWHGFVENGTLRGV